MSKTAHILAVDAAALPDYIHSGFHPMDEGSIFELLGGSLFVGPRPLLETDERFRQIIPYVVIKQGDEFIGYVRGSGGGEDRLHGKISIGVGGHIDLPDIEREHDGSINLAQTLGEAADREVDEEIDANVWFPQAKWVGLLSDNTDAVGRVHIGVVGLIHIDVGTEITSAEADTLTKLDAFSLSDLEQNRDRLESWTALLLPHLNDL